MTTQYNIHPVCQHFPTCQQTLRALRHSITRDGYDSRFPVILFDGLVLDGRHRVMVCKELGIVPATVDFEGSEQDAWRFALRANADRRPLTKGQVAIAYLLAHGADGIGTTELAGRLGVSTTTVSEARRVLRMHGEKKAMEVLRGNITLKSATRKRSKSLTVKMSGANVLKTMKIADASGMTDRQAWRAVVAAGHKALYAEYNL